MIRKEIEVEQAQLATGPDAVQKVKDVVPPEEGRRLAELISVPPDRVPGSARGLVTIRDDFDDPLDDFRDYM